MEKPGDERHADDPAAPGLDPVGADDAVAGVVGAFDQDVGRERLDQLERRVLVEQHDAVHRGEAGEHPGRAACSSATGRPAPLPRRRTDASVLTPDDQGVALAPGGLEQLDVAGVQQVEHAVGEDDAARWRGAPGDGAGRGREPWPR